MPEDNTTDTLLLESALERVGHVSATWAATLGQATRALHDHCFDLIITDLGLPDAHGSDAVLQLRTAGPESAIIVCSSACKSACPRTRSSPSC